MRILLILLLFLALLTVSDVMAQQLRIFTVGPTIMVPLRYLVERAGGKLDYYAEYDMIVIIDTPHYATMVFNRSDASIDKERVNMEQPLMIRDGVGYVPINFLAQILDMEVVPRTDIGEVILQDEETQLALPCRVNTEYFGSPIHFEALNGDLKRVSKLLNDGANINELDSDNDTPIAAAAFNLRVKTVTLLLEKGADVNIPVGRWGMRTPLLSLVTVGGIEGYLWNKPQDKMVQEAAHGLMQLLIASKANRGATDVLGWTALHEVISRGKEEEARLLLMYGFPPDIAATGGYTALMLAVDCGRADMVKFLLANYAKPNIADAIGETALTRANRLGREDIASLLHNYGATK